MKPDCNQFPAWMRWIAQDEDGIWWGYEHEPNMSDTGWYENEVGLSKKIIHQKSSLHWALSLKKINL